MAATSQSIEQTPAGQREPGVLDLMTRERWIEVGRIALTGLIAFLYWQ